MREEEVKSLLDKCIDKEYVMTKIVPTESENFSATISCNLSGDIPDGPNYDEQCGSFLKRFAKETLTNWVTYQRFENTQRSLFRKVFACQRSSKNKAKGSSRMDKKCAAKIAFKFKVINKNTCRRDKNLCKGLNCVINIDFQHSHPINATESISFLRCTDECIQIFKEYFERGMTPVDAKNYHELKLIESSRNSSHVLNLSHADLNPSTNQVAHIFNIWRKEKYGSGDPDSTVNVLRKKQIELEKKGNNLIIDDDPSTVAVLTPLMKRVLLNGDYSDKVFIDSTRLSDHMNSCVTFVFTSNKIGALPLACVIHKARTEESYRKAFHLLKKAIEECIEDKNFNPRIVETDDSDAERVVLESIFPGTTLLQRTFPTCQAVWRWLWEAENGIPENDCQMIMRLFQSILFANTIGTASENYNALSEKIKNMKNATEYFGRLWKTRLEWCLPFREHLIPKGKHMNNYCEVSIRVFKDIVWQRCKSLKSFSASALAELISNSFENHHSRRLINLAKSRRDQQLFSYYCKFENHSLNIHVDKCTDFDNEYLVHSSSDDGVSYTVNTTTCTCNCPYGREGRYCQHIFAVEKKFHLLVETHPILKKNDKLLCAKIALGDEKVDETFLRNMESLKDDEDEVSSCISNENDGSQMMAESIDERSDGEIDEDTVKADELVNNIKDELCRVADLLKWRSEPNLMFLRKFHKVLTDIKTPLQARDFARERIAHTTKKIIKVKLTSVARRKKRGISKGIQYR